MTIFSVLLHLEDGNFVFGKVRASKFEKDVNRLREGRNLSKIYYSWDHKHWSMGTWEGSRFDTGYSSVPKEQLPKEVQAVLLLCL